MIVILRSHLFLGLAVVAFSGCKPKPVAIDQRPTRPATSVQASEPNSAPRVQPPAPSAEHPKVDIQVGDGRGVDVKVGGSENGSSRRGTAR
jgi:hypothetical protein